MIECDGCGLEIPGSPTMTWVGEELVTFHQDSAVCRRRALEKTPAARARHAARGRGRPRVNPKDLFGERPT